jgi:thioredoxin-related protein
MDASTFSDPDVVAYVNEHFYAVKLNAEMKDEIEFKDHTFKWVNTGRNGIHTLAYSLLEGKMSYPSFVMMNESFDRIAIMPGYKQPEQLLKELRFAADDVYKRKSWDEYKGG